MSESEGKTKDLEGSNETPERTIVDNIDLHVGDRDIKLDVDEKGEVSYEVPEDIAGDPEKTAQFNTLVNEEMGHTLAKAKKKRYEQNLKEERLQEQARNLGLRWDPDLQDYVQTKPRETQERRPDVDTSNIVDDNLNQAYEQTYRKELMGNLGVKSDAEILELREDDPVRYEKAQTKAMAVANVAIAKLATSQTRDTISREQQERERLNTIANAVNRDGRYNSHQVIEFARKMKIDHLSPEFILTAFDTERKAHIDSTVDINRIQRIKSSTAKPILNKRSTGRDYRNATEKDVAAMSHEQTMKALNELEE